MNHVTFEHIRGPANIFAYHISKLRSIVPYNVLDPEEGRKNSDISFLMTYLPFQTNKKVETSMNQIQHIDIKFSHDEIRGLNKKNPIILR